MGSNVNFEDPRALAALIDHTLLKPDATVAQIQQLCSEAREYGFATVCVNPCWIPEAVRQLNGALSKVCSVIGFPLGASDSRVKLGEAEAALAAGAMEVDMVQNIGWLRSGNIDAVRNEIRDIAALVHQSGGKLKVILENCLLTDDLKVTACMLALESGADFVKTSTGFSSGGATVADIKLMRRTVDSKMGVKASGGIRTLETMQQMVRAGASRVGTSAGAAIIRELASGLDAASLREGKGGAGY